MSKYLVIYFDRYDTEDSSHEYIEASSFKDAIVESYGDEVDDDFDEYVEAEMIVNDDFACIAEEESDILCYRL